MWNKLKTRIRFWAMLRLNLVRKEDYDARIGRIHWLRSQRDRAVETVSKLRQENENLRVILDASSRVALKEIINPEPHTFSDSELKFIERHCKVPV